VVANSGNPVGLNRGGLAEAARIARLEAASVF